MNTINVTVKKTTRDGNAWFEVYAHDQAARDAVGANMGRSTTAEYAIVDFCRRTQTVMGGPWKYEPADLSLHFQG